MNEKGVLAMAKDEIVDENDGNWKDEEGIMQRQRPKRTQAEGLKGLFYGDRIAAPEKVENGVVLRIVGCVPSKKR